MNSAPYTNSPRIQISKRLSKGDYDSPHSASPLLPTSSTLTRSFLRKRKRTVAILFLGLTLLFLSYRILIRHATACTSTTCSSSGLVPYIKITKSRIERAFKLNGFDQCPMLNGASFDPAVFLHPLEGTILDKNPSAGKLIGLIEEEATRIEAHILQFFPNVHHLDSRLYSCWSAAEGATPLARLSDERFLVKIDGVNYFDNELPMLSQPSIIPGPRRSYKLAYLLMIHDERSLVNFKTVVDIIDDGLAIILVHVDKKSALLREKMNLWLSSRINNSTQQNIFLAQRSISNIWGSVQMVHTQLSGFWELIDLADWEFIINLSAYDYPLKRNPVIYQTLSSKKNAKKSWIQEWQVPIETSFRMLRPHIVKNDESSTSSKDEFGLHWWPFPKYKAYKQHQWMILHRDFVSHLRVDSDSLNLLAYMGHTFIPDEAYFAIALKNNERFSKLHVSDMKRYIRFEPNTPHPVWINYKERLLFPPQDGEPNYFFARKLDAAAEPQLIEWIKANYLDGPEHVPCENFHISLRSQCLKEIGQRIGSLTDPTDPTSKKSLILIPINLNYYDVAMNLRCSLSKLGIDNVIFWSLDVNIHSRLIDAGHISYIQVDGYMYSGKMSWHDGSLNGLMKQKPLVIEKFLGSGFDVIFLDADFVLKKDIRPLFRQDTTIDIYASIDENFPLESGLKKAGNARPIIGPGFVFFKNTLKTNAFMKHLRRKVSDESVLEDQEAWNILAKDPTILNLVDVGSSASTSSSSVARLKFLPQSQVINGHLFFANPERMAKDAKDYYAIHANSVEPMSAFKGAGLWFLENGVCK